NEGSPHSAQAPLEPVWYEQMPTPQPNGASEHHDGETFPGVTASGFDPPAADTMVEATPEVPQSLDTSVQAEPVGSDASPEPARAPLQPLAFDGLSPEANGANEESEDETSTAAVDEIGFDRSAADERTTDPIAATPGPPSLSDRPFSELPPDSAVVHAIPPRDHARRGAQPDDSRSLVAVALPRSSKSRGVTV